MCKSNLILGNFDKCKDPVLSILIPTYRGCEYLYQAIDSALNQNEEMNYEVVVVSNDSNSTLEGLKERYKGKDNFFLYQNTSNIGMVGNSNRCVELARGKYIAFLHDDDYLLENYISVIKKYMNRDNAIKCLITGRYVDYFGKIKKSESIKRRLRQIWFIPDLYRKKIQKVGLENCLKAGTNIYYSPSCGTVILKDVFMEIGGFDCKIEYSFDLDFFLRLNAVYDIYETTEICAVYRMGDNASLKPTVKYDFYEYFKTKFFEIMEENHISPNYINKYKDMFIYSVYIRLGKELDNELKKRNEVIIKANSFKFMIYRIMTAMYYYNHNLDIQRPKKMSTSR